MVAMLVLVFVFWTSIFGGPINLCAQGAVQANFESRSSDQVLPLEQRLFSEVNNIRAKHGLRPYLWSARLYQLADQHSRRMALEQTMEPMDLSGFEETPSLAGKISYWERVTSSVLKARADYSIAQIVNRLLGDEATRKNLLSKEFNRGAIGVGRDRDGRFFIAFLAGKEVNQESNLSLLEQEVFAAINQARVERGLRPLELSDQLRKVAREHSQEMALVNRLTHESMEGLGLAARLRAHRIKTRGAFGENVATNKRKSDPVKSAVDGWIASPGHAANLFNPDLTQTGIGIAIALDESYYFTQIFTK